jgi:signal transduction histidine kinase
VSEATISTRFDTIGAAAQERARIACEIHDVVSYGLATINIQAGVAAYVLDRRPEQAAEALHAIRSASREALVELRAILGMLRDPDGVVGEASPGLARLDALAASTSAAGAPTRVLVLGPARSLPASVDAAAFRVVQQALANILRHAPKSSALVTIRYERARITVEVENDCRTVKPTSRRSEGSRQGIIGMAERVRALNGHLEAGPRSDGGFRIRAEFPVLGRP